MVSSLVNVRRSKPDFSDLNDITNLTELPAPLHERTQPHIPISRPSASSQLQSSGRIAFISSLGGWSYRVRPTPSICSQHRVRCTIITRQQYGCQHWCPTLALSRLRRRRSATNGGGQCCSTSAAAADVAFT